MATFTKNGFTYDIILKPKNRKECIKWATGLKCTWERIPYADYINAQPDRFKTLTPVKGEKGTDRMIILNPTDK